MNSEIFNHMNWLAILIGAVGYFLLGAIWYSPVLFAKKWQEYVNMDMTSPDAKKGMGQIMIISFILMFVCVLGIAILVARLDLHGIASGIKLGILTGVCFSGTAIHIVYLYEKKPLGLHLINALYNVAGNIIAAIIICCWR